LIRVLCAEFNNWIAQGFPRGSAIKPPGNALITDETPVVSASVTESESSKLVMEVVPEWVNQVPRVIEKGGGWVRLPGVRGSPDEHDAGLSQEFWAAGILVQEPHLRLT